jgi:hypothetical protein
MANWQEGFKLNTSSSGQQIMEFSLVIGLVSLVSIGTLLLSSQGIANQLSSFLGGSPSQTTNTLTPTNTQKPPIVASNPLPNLGAPFQLPPPKPNQSRVCNDQGLCLNVLNFKPGQTAHEVAGGNGAETLIYSYSDNLLQLREQLALKGEDPALLDIITRLANSGHKLGESYPGMFESGNCTNMNYRNNVNNACRMTIQLTPEQLAQYNATTDPYAKGAFGLPHREASEALRTTSNELWYYFQNRYKDSTMPMGMDPIYQIISYHTNQINQIAQGFGGNAMSTNETGKFTFNLNQTNNAKLQTFEEANGICQTGGDMQQCFRPVQPPLENMTQQAASN